MSSPKAAAAKAASAKSPAKPAAAKAAAGKSARRAVADGEPRLITAKPRATPGTGLSAEAIRRQVTAALPPHHRRFYEQTKAYARIGAYLAVHAGVRPGVGLEAQAPSDLLGIRREFLDFSGDFGFIVVHGHTPVMIPELRSNRINIDTGAFATNRLTTLRIDGDGACIMPVAFRE